MQGLNRPAGPRATRFVVFGACRANLSRRSQVEAQRQRISWHTTLFSRFRAHISPSRSFLLSAFQISVLAISAFAKPRFGLSQFLLFSRKSRQIQPKSK
jgi:hypothetical protein